MKKTILKSLFIFIALFGLPNLNAQQITFPQPSPLCNVSQNFAIGKIEISYSRPSLRGRSVFGNIVPFNEVWRTGANSATTINFTEDVNINSQIVKAGKYGLLTIPAKDNWTIILTKDLNVTSAEDYKKENDVVRISAEPKLLSSAVETFTIDINNFTNTNANIDLTWENTKVSFAVTMNYDEKLSQQIEKTMGKDTRPYHSAASYYFDNKKDLNKATEWINKAVEINPAAYWSWLLKAKIHKANGDIKGALLAANSGLEKAKAESDNLYIGYLQTFINETTPLTQPKGKKK